MPTPATHLALAQEMLRRGDLSAAAQRLLNRHHGPFMLGHTAPDVKTVSGQKRETCHFYSIPRTSDRPAYQILFARHPELAQADVLSPARAAFVAGYVAHLVLDELWLSDVFQRYFLRDWGAPSERLFLHNVLRTWVDSRDQGRLSGSVAQVLRRVEPDDWLPFVDDEYLRAWRDWLVEQLVSDQRMETAEVLARRMGIPAREVKAVVGSSEQMERRVFCHFPRAALQSFREKGYRGSVVLTDWYLNGSIRWQAERATIKSSGWLPADLLPTQELSS